MKKLIIAIAVISVIASGCGGTSTAPESAAPATTSESSASEYGIDVDLVVSQNKSGRTIENLVAHCNSTECTPELLKAYYFNAYLPEANSFQDDTIVKAYLIFDDLTGTIPAEYGEYVGCELWTGYAYTYVCMNQKDNGLFETTEYFTPDWCSYVVDEDAGTFELYSNIDDLEDFEREYLIDI